MIKKRINLFFSSQTLKITLANDWEKQTKNQWMDVSRAIFGPFKKYIKTTRSITQQQFLPFSARWRSAWWRCAPAFFSFLFIYLYIAIRVNENEWEIKMHLKRWVNLSLRFNNYGIFFSLNIHLSALYLLIYKSAQSCSFYIILHNNTEREM